MNPYDKEVYQVTLMSISPISNAYVASGIERQDLYLAYPQFAENPSLIPSRPHNIKTVSMSALDHVNLSVFVKSNKTDLLEVVRLFSHSNISVARPYKGQTIITGTLSSMLMIAKVAITQNVNCPSTIRLFTEKLWMAIPDPYIEVAGLSRDTVLVDDELMYSRYKYL